MKCDRMEELLLEASPGELRGEGDGRVSRHVRECPDCGRLARAFLEAGERLERGLEGILRSGSEEKILRALRRELAGAAVGDDTPVVPLRRAGLWRIGAPLAVAAALAAVLLVADGPEPLTRDLMVFPVPPESGDASPVEVRADRSFAVMQTGDPKIHVVWFY